MKTIATHLRLLVEPHLHHPFLMRFECGALTPEQLERFALQWYLTAREHKQAFPAIVLNTPYDELRCTLIEVLREEYGNGDASRTHAQLLRRFLRKLGHTDEQMDAAEPIPAVRVFGQQVLATWRDGDPARAYGLHFALEVLAASIHTHLANGLETYTQFEPTDIAYFTLHREAEQQHAADAEGGLVFYSSPSDVQLLQEGTEEAVGLLNNLWNGFSAHVFRPLH